VIWIIVAYAAMGLGTFLLCMATASGIVRDIYEGEYPESAGAGFVAISCILIFSILAAILWPIALISVVVILIIDNLRNRGDKNEN